MLTRERHNANQIVYDSKRTRIAKPIKDISITYLLSKVASFKIDKPKDEIILNPSIKLDSIITPIMIKSVYHSNTLYPIKELLAII